MTISEFKVGQRVQQFDEDYNRNVFGTVEVIHSDGVEILWDDMVENCIHTSQEDLDNIYPFIFSNR